ncbi:uncharacterized protein LOC127851418 [Dreissena polymorpha]|uniref:BRCT domain-containing protein n=1 Tax=Dreissena polymorpha TaxID=45954 RepID=A0A9D4HXS3_DREPO|nr:uncharacterized protein LOC127851418 [Dreissena polymorpha]KAH3736794.1 hypothetical protein DPMN_043367 [Dreissena polymorpha]
MVYVSDTRSVNDKGHIMALFAGCQIVFDLDVCFKTKVKLQLIGRITSLGGVVSYLPSKKCSHIVCSDAKHADRSYKSQRGLQLGIPVVATDWVYASLGSNSLLDVKQYLLVRQPMSTMGDGENAGLESFDVCLPAAVEEYGIHLMDI